MTCGSGVSWWYSCDQWYCVLGYVRCTLSPTACRRVPHGVGVAAMSPFRGLAVPTANRVSVRRPYGPSTLHMPCVAACPCVVYLTISDEQQCSLVHSVFVGACTLKTQCTILPTTSPRSERTFVQSFVSAVCPLNILYCGMIGSWELRGVAIPGWVCPPGGDIKMGLLSCRRFGLGLALLWPCFPVFEAALERKSLEKF